MQTIFDIRLRSKIISLEKRQSNQIFSNFFLWLSEKRVPPMCVRETNEQTINRLATFFAPFNFLFSDDEKREKTVRLFGVFDLAENGHRFDFHFRVLNKDEGRVDR